MRAFEDRCSEPSIVREALRRFLGIEAEHAARRILGVKLYDPSQHTTTRKKTKMPDTVEIAVRLRCFVRSEGESWVSGCPSLDVFSQAATADEAKGALREAVELWVESCLERGTLEQALREVGWHLSSGLPIPPEGEDAATGLQPADEVLGEPFPLEVTIPAFQATAVPEPARRAAG